MDEIETRCFELIDEYARRKHKCFLTEFFRYQTEDYTLCFRPASVGRKSQERYSCKYIQLRVDEVTTIGANNKLPPSIAEKIDDQLRALVDG